MASVGRTTPNIRLPNPVGRAGKIHRCVRRIAQSVVDTSKLLGQLSAVVDAPVNDIGRELMYVSVIANHSPRMDNARLDQSVSVCDCCQTTASLFRHCELVALSGVITLSIQGCARYHSIMVSQGCE